jgi:tetratricopeptide (TPR) repeat protein
MRWAGLLAAILALTAASSPAPARAQGTAPDEASPEDQERALLLFEESLELYRTGRFSDAAGLLRQAYSLHAEPVLLYNLARALEGDGDLTGAIDAYQRYLDTAGEIPDRGAIERKLGTLRATMEERLRLAREAEEARRERDTATQRDRAPAPPSTDAGGPSPLPWIVAGVGAAGFAVAGLLGGLALGAHDAALEAPSQRATDDEQSRARDLAVGANIAFVVSGIVLAAGVTWGVIDLVSAPGDEESATVRLRILPAIATLEGSFR